VNNFGFRAGDETHLYSANSARVNRKVVYVTDGTLVQLIGCYRNIADIIQALQAEVSLHATRDGAEVDSPFADP
jgi:hypothetical protein